LDSNQTYQVKLYTDGENTATSPAEYKVEEFTVDSSTSKEIKMHRTGGFVMVIAGKL